jgi:hypothetical protein
MKKQNASTPNINEPHPLFPSGEWEGFYTYREGIDAARYYMSFFLHFQNRIVKGDGSDNVGTFSWTGSYNTELFWCKMTKRYATHTVFYDGRVDENGIWGTWIISERWKGGFHIWLKKASENVEVLTEALDIEVPNIVKII